MECLLHWPSNKFAYRIFSTALIAKISSSSGRKRAIVAASVNSLVFYPLYSAYAAAK